MYPYPAYTYNYYPAYNYRPPYPVPYAYPTPHPRPRPLITMTATPPKVPVKVWDDVDLRLPVSKVELVHRWSPSYRTYLYALWLHIDKAYDGVQSYWLDVSPRADLPPFAEGRASLAQLYRRDPLPHPLVARSADFKVCRKTGNVCPTVRALVEALEAEKLCYYVFPRGRDAQECALEWSMQVIRLWAKKKLIEDNEEGLKKWKHLTAAV